MLAARRRARGWSLRDAGRHTGISFGYLGLLERGQRAPSTVVAAVLARVYELTPADSSWLWSGAVADVGRDYPGRRTFDPGAGRIHVPRRDLPAALERSRGRGHPEGPALKKPSVCWGVTLGDASLGDDGNRHMHRPSTANFDAQVELTFLHWTPSRRRTNVFVECCQKVNPSFNASPRAAIPMITGVSG